MATTTRTTTGRDQWVRFKASWDTYLSHLKDRGERSKPRLIYESGRLTIVSPSGLHDVLKTRLGGLIEDLFFEMNIPYLAFGSTTLLSQAGRRSGTEGDESYYLRNFDLVRGKDDLQMGQDPPPDLMVEVAISRPATPSLNVYRRLGAGEVWVCKRSSLTFFVLDEGGKFVARPASARLPFLRPDDLTPWLFRRDFADDTARRAEYRRWVHGVLRPRSTRPEGEAPPREGEGA